MEVASGYCLQSGVTGASGGLTLQPRCNVPNDSKVTLLSLLPRACRTLQGFRTSVQRLHDSQEEGTGCGMCPSWTTRIHIFLVLIVLLTPAGLATNKCWSAAAASHINLHRTHQHW